jgi:predicted MFS family arabinose efflux permease
VLIAGVGLAWCFFLNGISYIAVIGGLYAMRVRDLHRREAPSDGGRFREGLRYVWSTPELRSPLLLMAVLFTFSFNFSVLLPLLAQGTFHGGAGTYGSLLSLMGAGSLVGALAMARRNTPSPKRLALWAIGFGLVSMLSAVAPTLGTEMVVLVPLGLVAIAFMITANSTLQLTARPEMRGRVMALYSVVFLGGTPIGAPIAGFIGEHLGPRVGIALGALTAVAAGSIGLRALARLGTPSALGAEPELVTAPVITEPHLAIEEALTA